MSIQRNFKEHYIAAVVRRSGICRATVEQVLSAVFDELRYQLTEGPGCVPVESFGTFAVIDIPERQYLYTYGGRNEVRNVAPTKRIKFAPTRNLRNEINACQFDPTRRAFVHHPSDPPMRSKSHMGYDPRRDFHRAPVPTDPDHG